MSFAPLPVFEVELDGVQLVEASAGTGKTWTLCALLLRLLLERELPLREVLVVTFTKAATAELRERVRDRLQETRRYLLDGQAGADPFVPELVARLRGLGREDARLLSRLDMALQGFDEAAIFTIHGFAQRSLAELGFAAGLPTQLEALTDEAPLREELARAWWRRELVAPGRQPAALLAWLQAQGDSPEQWALQLGRHLRLPLAEALWPDPPGPPPADPEPLRAALAARWTSEREDLLALLTAALPTLNGQTYKPASLEQTFADWDALLAGAAAPGPKARLLGAKLLQEKTKKNQIPPRHRFFDEADALLDALDAQAAQLEAEARWLRCRWLLEGTQALAAHKRERGLIGYDDMLGLLHERLQQPAALALLRERYQAALVDEFQDTDPLQYRVFAQLFPPRDRCCFYVGDPKQAIYRFRQADLPTYLQARGEAEAVWTLTQNQRSVPPLLEALNAFFGRHANAFLVPGLDYPPVQAGAKPKPLLQEHEASAPLQLWSWDPDADGAWPLHETARRLALDATAADIARRLHPQEGDHPGDRLGERALQAGDIAVLVRTHRQAARVAEALAAVGVDSVALSQASVWRSAEAAELQALLEALLGPPRAALQRAALATVMLGLDAAALAALREDAAAQALWQERWTRWRQLAQELPVAALLQRCLSEAGVPARLLALPQGERRLTNLLHLLELLQAAQQEQAGAAALLAWLQRQRHEGAGGEDAQLRLESDAARVAIVTIHRSKGLEYPIVYCPFAFEGPGRDRDGADWGRPRRDAAGRQQLDYRGGEPDEAEKAERRAEALAEELRLHYVALTRAVQRCVLVVGPYRRRAGRGFSSSESAQAAIHHFATGAGAAAPDLDAIDLAWSAPLAQTALRRLQAEALAPIALSPPPAPALAARAAPAALPPLRWTGSFSRLVEPDAHASALGEPPAALAADDFLRFPRGSVAGDCLHAALERADLAQPAGWPAAIDAALRLHPPGSEGDPAWPAQLQQALQRAAHTPLAEGLRLAELPAARTMREWAFQLQAPALRLDALRELLLAHGHALPALRGHSLRGYLRGFVDLVVEHQGRFWVIDWKSNHLGYSAADYAPAALAPTVADHGYALQGLLYLLALHRHLRLRLPGYTPEQHLGGALLLFVRGLQTDRRDGQFALPADAALIADLDRLFS